MCFDCIVDARYGNWIRWYLKHRSCCAVFSAKTELFCRVVLQFISFPWKAAVEIGCHTWEGSVIVFCRPAVQKQIFDLPRSHTGCAVCNCVIVGQCQYWMSPIGAFAKLRKATIGFVMSVCPHGTTRVPLDGFSWSLIFESYSKICRENSSFIKIW
jgi:hypothetical protein